ncbi:MAG: OmpA family protein [Calditrichaceae bacterium]|nr:OmpA family protein [Calditrichaceae bacterium]
MLDKMISMFIIITVICFFYTDASLAQNSLKNNLFKDYLDIIENAKQKNADVLSPEFFRKAQEKYNEADSDYDKNKNGGLKDIRRKLDESKQFAEKALEVVELANLYLKTSIEAREDALAANAPLYALSLWNEAEKIIHDAGINLEDDDINDAREAGNKATDLYRKAELAAIKNGILGEARKEIELAEKADAMDYAYHTIMDAKNQLIEAEKLIESNPYDRADALAKSKKAAYQGRHAKYLANTIKKLSQKDTNWETLILKIEDILTEIAKPLNASAEFDEGFDKSVKDIVGKLNELIESEKQAHQENETLHAELDKIKEIDADKTALLEKQKILDQKISNIRSLFTTQEAKIVHESNNLIIRLYGLNFPSGQAIIQPEYFSLLSKVQKAILEFPDKYILIEGHTDALGSPETNRILSEKRAAAVKEYLLANMNLEDRQITHYGLGDQRPIASNKTVDGRAKNRRIDIVISLQE